MRLLFVGQAPSKETDGLPPFVGKSGRFLADLLGTTQASMLADHDFVNVLERWPGKGIGGDKFPIHEARARGVALLPMFADRVAVLLGANVARAFGAASFEYFKWYELRDPRDARVVAGKRVTICPHPSGVNRLYNNPVLRKNAREFFANLLAK